MAWDLAGLTSILSQVRVGNRDKQYSNGALSRQEPRISGGAEFFLLSGSPLAKAWAEIKRHKLI